MTYTPAGIENQGHRSRMVTLSVWPRSLIEDTFCRTAMQQSMKPRSSVNLLEVLLESLARSFFVRAGDFDVEIASAGTKTSLCLPLACLSTQLHCLKNCPRSLITSDSLHWNTRTHPFNGPFSGTTHVSQYQKGRTNLDFTEARDSEWQWHQLGHMQVCHLLQTTTPASHHSVFLQAGCPSCRPTNNIKALKATVCTEKVKKTPNSPPPCKCTTYHQQQHSGK